MMPTLHRPTMLPSKNVEPVLSTLETGGIAVEEMEPLRICQNVIAALGYAVVDAGNQTFIVELTHGGQTEDTAYALISQSGNA